MLWPLLSSKMVVISHPKISVTSTYYLVHGQYLLGKQELTRFNLMCITTCAQMLHLKLEGRKHREKRGSIIFQDQVFHKKRPGIFLVFSCFYGPCSGFLCLLNPQKRPHKSSHLNRLILLITFVEC